jgi:hypothetical protein
MSKIVSILLGFLQLGLGVAVGGGGHGWNTGFYFSFISFIFFCLIPFLKIKKAIALFLIFLNIVCTSLMFVQTKNEGVNYFKSSWNGFPFLIIIFFLLWFGWPIIYIVRLTLNNQQK